MITAEFIAAVSGLLWPLVILILGLRFYKPIINVFSRMSKGKFTKEGVEIEVGDKGLSELAEKGEKAAETLTAVAEQAEHLFRQGKPYEDYSDAFRDVEERIRDCLNDALKSGIENPQVELKLIAVAMTFSWNFIVSKIPRILHQYSTAKIKMEVLFIDHAYLNSLGLAQYEVNWSETSRQRINEVRDFAKLCDEQFNGRLLFTANSYKNLPHWHGWLINKEFLFLGRTNWQFPNDKPKLLVGQNKYRYFDNNGSEGAERIQLFANWHRYYFDFASEQVCHTSQH